MALAWPAGAEPPPTATSTTPAPRRFALVDISPVPAPPLLHAQVESEIARLRPDLRLVEDAPLRQALATGEPAEVAAERMIALARESQKAGDCANARARAEAGAQVALEGAGLDAERDLLKQAYAVILVCADALARPDDARTAAARLGGLVAGVPAGVSAELWAKYVRDPATAPPGAPVEVTIDSEPTNATVAVDFRSEGHTPRVLKLLPGSHVVEIEKDDHVKGVRHVTVGTDAARVVMRLVPKAQDRASQIVTTLVSLRGADPARRKRALSRLCQSARTDVLAVVQVPSPGLVRIWFFDADRGDVTGESIQSLFDPLTGRVAALAQRPTPAAAPAPVPAATPDAAGKTVPPALAVGLPESTVKSEVAEYNAAPWRKNDDLVWDHWWGWAAAAAVVAGVVGLVWLDEPKSASDLDVTATWSGPR